MAVKPGYKQTEIGVIPEDWEIHTIGDSMRLTNGRAFRPEDWVERGLPIIRIQNLNDTDSAFNYFSGPVEDRHLIEAGDLLFAWSGTTGISFGARVWHGPTSVLNQHIFKVMPNHRKLTPAYALLVLRKVQEHIEKQAHGFKASFVHVKKSDLVRVQLPVPPTKTEQETIAKALRDADALIESLEQLLTKRRQLKQGAMHDLLTGKKRLPGFSGEWKVKRIAEIAFPSAEKNGAGASFPVLTCSKHSGFVDSLGYFKSQVFSRDTSGYRVIRRGQIGYPANHVEEGSIGLQDLYDVALVSPIYVVFSVNTNVSSYFLHRLLKLDSYRQTFKTATTSSVDRRGSLRWPAFSQITVSLPQIEEQTAIAAILADMDAEIVAQDARLTKVLQLKQGMMQELLTGRIRLV